MSDESLQVHTSANHPSRYQWTENGMCRGFIEYYAFGKVAIVTHTEVDPGLKGGGHGSRLAAQALAFFREQDCQVVPVCAFFAHFIRKNPEYVNIATPESRRIFDLLP